MLLTECFRVAGSPSTKEPISRDTRLAGPVVASGEPLRAWTPSDPYPAWLDHGKGS